MIASIFDDLLKNVSQRLKLWPWERADRVLTDAWNGWFALGILPTCWHRTYISGVEGSGFCMLEAEDENEQKEQVFEEAFILVHPVDEPEIARYRYQLEDWK